jgi:hypothetical protein
LFVDWTVFVRFRGAVVSYAKSARSATDTGPPKSGRETAQVSCPLGVGDVVGSDVATIGPFAERVHPAIHTATSIAIGFTMILQS